MIARAIAALLMFLSALIVAFLLGAGVGWLIKAQPAKAAPGPQLTIEVRYL